MAMQPSKEDIGEMMSICDLPEQEVIARLKNNNNNLNQAVTEYFDNPESTSYKWTESDWNSDRDGASNNAGISFNIQGADVDPTNPWGMGGGALPPASRPPSRTGNRLPLSNVVDLTAQHAAAGYNNHDAELQMALRQSAAEAGLEPQESGIADSTGTSYFGPANRDHYDSNQWALVPRGTAQEIILDPEPNDRRRASGMPAFLKPSPRDNRDDSHRLGGLLTILHSIPAARSALVDSRFSTEINDYGFHSKWWTGQAINLPISQPDQELVAELQRLMAFLDLTERAYGSAENVANLLSSVKLRTIEVAFFETWQAIHRDDNPQPAIITLVAEGSEDVDIADYKVIPFGLFDLSLNISESDAKEFETLYDLIDAQLSLVVGRQAFLAQTGQVITLRVEFSSLPAGVAIPAVWYADRYLAEASSQVTEWRKHRRQLKKTITELESKEAKISRWQLPNGKEISVKEMFKVALLHDAETVPNIARGFRDSSLRDDMDDSRRVNSRVNTSEELRRAMESIDKILADLENSKADARAKLRELSKRFTGANEDEPLKAAYNLQGVLTADTTTYIRKKPDHSQSDLIDMDVDTSAATPEWWKITYLHTMEKPVSITTVTQEQVLLAAREESKSTILVYASEEAMNAPRENLTPALCNFVRADNMAFDRELREQNAQESSSTPPLGKRKLEDSSSNLAEGRGEAPDRPDWAGWRQNNGLVSAFDSSESGTDTVTPPNTAGEDLMMQQDQGVVQDLVDTSMPPMEPSRPQEMEEWGGKMSFAEAARGTESHVLDQVMTDASVVEESEAVKGAASTGK